MTATVDAQHLHPIHPLGAESHATPHTAAHAGEAPPTPAPSAERATTVPVMPFGSYDTFSRALTKDEILYLSGDFAENAYLIEAGLVALSLEANPERERILALAGPGDVIGALTPGPIHHLETATALSASVLVKVLPRRAADGGELRFDPAVEQALSRAAGVHLSRLAHALADTEVPVPARIARTMVRLAERFGQESAGGGMRLTLPITHDTIAAMVGAARETTTSVMQSLRQLGLLEGTRGRYLFDPEALRSYGQEISVN